MNRKLIVGLAVVLGVTQCHKKDTPSTPLVSPIVSDTTSYPIGYDTVLTPTWDDFVNAVIFVESSGRDSVVGDNGRAVGCLQIRKCMVDDVNRILKRQKLTLSFTYNDRWSRDKSTQMFEIYCKHYNLTTNEEVARCWNGGPRGINNPATVGYWNKVKDKINS